MGCMDVAGDHEMCRTPGRRDLDDRSQQGRDTPTAATAPTRKPRQPSPKTPLTQRPPRTPPTPATPARAIVLHGAPTKYKPGQMRRWIAEGNQGGAQILGIRWLVQEHKRGGKLASSLVIYLKDSVVVNRGLRMGRKIFRTTEYDWDR